MTLAVLEAEVKDTVETKLEAFVGAVEGSKLLELDGIIYKDAIHEGKKITEDGLKILHRKKRLAYHVPVEAIAEYDIPILVEAIEIGVFDKVYNITRIVGYYSRVNNWNKSKKAELRDRIRGRAAKGYYVSPDHQPSHIEESLSAVPHG